MSLAFILFLSSNWWTDPPAQTRTIKIAVQDGNKCIVGRTEKILRNAMFKI